MPNKNLQKINNNKLAKKIRQKFKTIKIWEEKSSQLLIMSRINTKIQEWIYRIYNLLNLITKIITQWNLKTFQISKQAV